MGTIDTDRERRGGSGRTSAAADLEGATAEIGALVQAHPVGAIATALGVGYFVGGGLFTRFTSRVLRTAFSLGIRFAVMPALERELAGLAGGTGQPAPSTERASRGRNSH